MGEVVESLRAEVGLDERAERPELTLSELPVCLWVEEGRLTGCMDM